MSRAQLHTAPVVPGAASTRPVRVRAAAASAIIDAPTAKSPLENYLLFPETFAHLRRLNVPIFMNCLITIAEITLQYGVSPATIYRRLSG